MFRMAEKITKRAQRLVDALRRHAAWMDRGDLAQAIGKNRLNPHDIELLDGLVDMGLVERNEQATGITMKYVYRSTS